MLKADVQGSVEAVADALGRLSTGEVKLKVLHGSVGGITESDILLAAASNAIVIGFNVRPEAKGAALATKEGVEVRLYTIIYEAVADVRAAMEGLLEPTFREQTHAHVEVRQIFNIAGIGTIAGAYVTDGKIARGNQVRLLRDQVVVHEGKLASLKRFKDDVREVAAGYECGLSLESYQDLKQGDVIEAYERIPGHSAYYSGSAWTRRAARERRLICFEFTSNSDLEIMVVGVLKVKLLIPENHSLKGKRGVLKRIQARTANQFNISITECDDQDLWQSSVLGFAVAGTSQPVVEATLHSVVDFIESLGLVEVGDTGREFFHC